MGPAVDELAPAKVNLTLAVVGRRADGLHELDSLVVFAGVGDRLRFTAADQLELEAGGRFAAALGAAGDNLVWRAATLLAEAAGRRPGVRITLDKRLPVAAGLGGGSSDAAATLRGLDRLWRLSFSTEALMALGRRLGADVPVCVLGVPARMRGIGERVEPLPAWPALDLLLVNPNQPLATARVFAGLDPSAIGAGPPQSPPAPLGVLDWLRRGGNDLERPACRALPVIEEVLKALRAQPGCRLARMSGSGATCFGLFADRATCAAAAGRLRRTQPAWWLAATVTAGA